MSWKSTVRVVGPNMFSFNVTEHFPWIPWILFIYLFIQKNTSIEQDESLRAKNLGRKLEGYSLCTQTHDGGWLVIVVYSCLPRWKFQWSVFSNWKACLPWWKFPWLGKSSEFERWGQLEPSAATCLVKFEEDPCDSSYSDPHEPQLFIWLENLCPGASAAVTELDSPIVGGHLRLNLWKSYLLSITIPKKGTNSQNCQDYIYFYILLRRARWGGSSIYHGYRWEQPDTCVTPLPFFGSVDRGDEMALSFSFIACFATERPGLGQTLGRDADFLEIGHP